MPEPYLPPQFAPGTPLHVQLYTYAWDGRAKVLGWLRTRVAQARARQAQGQPLPGTLGLLANLPLEGTAEPEGLALLVEAGILPPAVADACEDLAEHRPYTSAQEEPPAELVAQAAGLYGIILAWVNERRAADAAEDAG